ncbi:PREDICTED: cornifin-B-like [Mesitornis unicolor]|uniref:cornifin-B-like n=1 Tax=Mesitornis unicolor TaxID=54374 RepID=UPI0005288976|nr:PREDICTED: cornifin-B-like [Mesitornis unicolor]
MSYYGYQYKQQCYIPSGVKCGTPVLTPCHNPGVVKCTTPVFTPCHNPGVVKCSSCTSCAPKGAQMCAVRKTVQSIPKCSTPCSSQCVKTQVVEGHSSCCSPTCPAPCTMAFPQPLMQGRGHLCVPHCGQPSMRCPQTCAPAQMYQHGSCPYSYQWSNSYQYNCGQQ